MRKGVITAMLIAVLFGCEEDDDYNFCEDEASPWNCDCFDAEDEPMALERGLSQACEQAKSTLEHCIEIGEADDSVDYRTANVGRENLANSDLCNGNGLDDYPSGCMSREAFNDLMNYPWMKCPTDMSATWDLIVGGFKTWEKYWSNQ